MAVYRLFRTASALFLKQGGKMGEDDVSEMDRKKMEVRARLEQQSQAKKKKGFMTPERKKKLRVSFAELLLRPRF